MSGEGHIADMITRMKNNEALRKERKERQKKLSETYRKDVGTHESQQIRNSTVSPEVLERVKEHIHESTARERKSTLIETTVLTAVILLALVLAVVMIF